MHVTQFSFKWFNMKPSSIFWLINFTYYSNLALAAETCDSEAVERCKTWCNQHNSSFRDCEKTVSRQDNYCECGGANVVGAAKVSAAVIIVIVVAIIVFIAAILLGVFCLWRKHRVRSVELATKNAYDS